MNTIIETVTKINNYTRIDRFHSDYKTTFSYIKTNKQSGPVTIEVLHFDRILHIESRSDAGILIRGLRGGEQWSLYLPEIVFIGSCDLNNRLKTADIHQIFYTFEFNNTINLVVNPRNGDDNIFSYSCVFAEDRIVNLFNEIIYDHEVERKKYLKSVWFCAENPTDIWKYLINGSIYDPIPGRGSHMRYKCQQCAYSWWDYFGYLKSHTSKKIYDVFQDELAYSIDQDLQSKGDWKHGAWSDEMETHTRFQLDGIQLFISQYLKTSNRHWLTRAEFAMKYLIDDMVTRHPDGSIWFLHDSTADKTIHRVNGRILGENNIHSITINTHVQALFVLARLVEYSNQKKYYEQFIHKGLASLKNILELSPAESIYNLIIPWCVKHQLRDQLGGRKQKVIKVLEKRLLMRIYWYLRKRYPRFVYPNGLTERDLILTFMPLNYHVINIKDLLTLYRYYPENWLETSIRKGVDFLMKLTDRSVFMGLLESNYIFVEVTELLKLYSKMIDKISDDDINRVKEKIFIATGGYSLDAEIIE